MLQLNLLLWTLFGKLASNPQLLCSYYWHYYRYYIIIINLAAQRRAASCWQARGRHASLLLVSSPTAPMSDGHIRNRSIDWSAKRPIFWPLDGQPAWDSIIDEFSRVQLASDCGDYAITRLPWWSCSCDSQLDGLCNCSRYNNVYKQQHQHQSLASIRRLDLSFAFGLSFSLIMMMMFLWLLLLRLFASHKTFFHLFATDKSNFESMLSWWVWSERKHSPNHDDDDYDYDDYDYDNSNRP